MKFFKYFLLLFFTLSFITNNNAGVPNKPQWNDSTFFKDTTFLKDTPKDTNLKPEEQEELRNFAGQLIDMLTDPNDTTMTPQKRKELIDTTVQQTIQYDNYLKNLPEKDRLEEEKKIEDAVSYLMDKDGPLGNVFQEDALPPQVIEEEFESEAEEPLEVKGVAPKIEPLLSKDINDIKNTLENIVTRISSLLIKVKSMPRVSSDKNVENAWSKLRLPLTIVESLLRIITRHNKLLNSLLDKEYSEVRDTLSKLESILNKLEKKFTVPDTAGSAIVYDDGDEVENIQFVKSQKQLEGIINSLIPILTPKNIEALRKFMEKNAPELLKQNPELLKNFDNFARPDFAFPSSPIIRSGASSLPSYPKGSVGIPGFDPYSYGGGVPATSSPGLDSGLSEGAKGGGASGDKKAGDKQKEDKQKDGKKDTKPKSDTEDKKDKDGDSSKSEATPSIENQISDLKKALETVSNSLKKTDIYDVVRKLRRKDKKDNTVDIDKFQKDFNELSKSYEPATEAARKLDRSIKSFKGEKKDKEKHEEALKKAYKKKDLKLDSEYEQVKMALKVINETNLTKSNIETIKDIAKKHKELIAAVGIKDTDLLDELKNSSKKLADSIGNFNVVEVDAKLGEEGDDEKVETLALLDRQLKKLKETHDNILNLIDKIDEMIESFRKNDPKDQYKEAVKKVFNPFVKRLDNLYDELRKNLRELDNLDKEKIEKINDLIDKYDRIKRLLKVFEEEEEKEDEEEDNEDPKVKLKESLPKVKRG